MQKFFKYRDFFLSFKKIGESNDDEESPPVLRDETAAVSYTCAISINYIETSLQLCLYTRQSDAVDDDLFSPVKSPTAPLFSCDATNSNSAGSPFALLTSRQPVENKRNPEDLSRPKEDEPKDTDVQYTVDIENKSSVWLLIPPEIQVKAKCPILLVKNVFTANEPKYAL